MLSLIDDVYNFTDAMRVECHQCIMGKVKVIIYSDRSFPALMAPRCFLSMAFGAIKPMKINLESCILYSTVQCLPPQHISASHDGVMIV